MSPHPELVQEYPQPFCLAQPGEEYVIYLRYGGVARLKMDENSASKNYVYQWYNPGTGKLYDAASLKGSDYLKFVCPESYPESHDYKDWVLYIRKE